MLWWPSKGYFDNCSAKRKLASWPDNVWRGMGFHGATPDSRNIQSCSELAQIKSLIPLYKKGGDLELGKLRGFYLN